MSIKKVKKVSRLFVPAELFVYRWNCVTVESSVYRCTYSCTGGLIGVLYRCTYLYTGALIRVLYRCTYSCTVPVHLFVYRCTYWCTVPVDWLFFHFLCSEPITVITGKSVQW